MYIIKLMMTEEGNKAKKNDVDLKKKNYIQRVWKV